MHITTLTNNTKINHKKTRVVILNFTEQFYKNICITKHLNTIEHLTFHNSV